MLTLFVSFTSIANANLQNSKQVAIYSVSQEQMRASHHSFLANLNSLNANAKILASLLSATTTSLQGVPIALVNTALNCARGMVLGNWSMDEEEDEILLNMDLNKIDLKESQRRAAGWIIISGLLGLGNQWVSSKLPFFIRLWTSVFSKEMCQVDAIRIQEPSY